VPPRAQPNFNAVVECLPCCVSEARPAAYPPTTAGRHLLDKYAATHAGYSEGAKGGGHAGSSEVAVASKGGGGGGAASASNGVA
jgi:hypothetical protein